MGCPDLRIDRLGALSVCFPFQPGERERCSRVSQAREHDILNTFADLIHRAQPYWYQASRKRKHQKIAAATEIKETVKAQAFGRFPLSLQWIYTVQPGKTTKPIVEKSESNENIFKMPDRSITTAQSAS